MGNMKLRRIELILLTVILYSLIVGGVISQSCSLRNIEEDLEYSSFIEEDYFIEWESPRNLNTPHIYTGGVITVNYTVLPNSLSNVSLLAPTSDRYDWSPIPYNITLQSGEQHTDTFRLLRGIGGGGFLSYSAVVFEENSSATVRFGYKIINQGSKPASLPIDIILFSFIIISRWSLVRRRKKQ